MHNSIRVSSDRVIGVGTLITMGLWLALATGLFELAIVVFQRSVLGLVIHRGAHFLWMIPVGYLLLLAAPVVIAAVGVQLLPAARRLRAALFLFVLLGVASQLVVWFLFRLHPAAILVLSLGAAMQASVVLERISGRYLRLIRWTGLGGVVIVALLAVGSFVVPRVRESRDLARLEPAGVDAPNVLLIILDTVRAANLSLYGYERPTTPRLEQWAAQAIVFEQAVAPAPWTLPSHASVFTGRPAHELSANWTAPLDGRDTTLAEVLRQAGYATGGFVANRHFATAEWGLDRGFLHYEDYRVSLGEIVRTAGLGERLEQRWSLRPLLGTDQPIGRKTAAQVSDGFLAWQTELSSRPFFAFLNFYDAHDPYLPPEPWKSQFAGGRSPSRLSPYRRYERDQLSGVVAELDVQDELNAYDGAIAYLDSEVGRLLDELNQRGVLGNTIVIVTSDHGELFGEHGVYLHGRSLYAPELLVPLFILAPERGPGARVHGPVSLVDVAATVLDLAGLTGLPGRSLMPNGGEASPPREAVSSVRRGIRIPEHYPVATGDIVGAMFGRWHFVRHESGAEQLFDLTSDPAEQINLASDPGVANVLARGRSLVPALPLDPADR